MGAWTWRNARALDRRLRAEGIEAIAGIEQSPSEDACHRSTVSAVLRMLRTTCLVRAGVLQRWDADHAFPRPLIVGVDLRSAGGFAAHAWLAGDSHSARFSEIHRRPPSFRG